MATKEKQAVGAGQPAAERKEQKSGGGRPKQKEAKVRGPHAGANLPVPAPRLKEMYESKVRPALMKQFGFTNPHQVPTLEKIAINVGMGEAIKQPKILDGVVDELAIITGQAPVRKKAKKSIANYGLRQGQEIGAAVTLRGAKMWSSSIGSSRSRSRASVTSRVCPPVRSTAAATTASASRSR